MFNHQNILALSLTSFALFGVANLGPKSALLLIILLINRVRVKNLYLEINTTGIFIFCLAYYFIASFYGLEKTEVSPHVLYFPALMYMAGKWYSVTTKSSIDLVSGILCVAISLSGIAVITVVYEVINNGFLSGGRNIVLLGSGDFETSATVVSGLCILLFSNFCVCFVLDKNLENKKILKYVSACAALIGLVVAARVGSRTLITIFLGTVVVVTIVGYRWFNKEKLLLSVLFMICLYVVIGVDLNGGVLNYFEDRIDSNDAGLDSAGGRSERWMDAVGLIFGNPLGWDFSMHGYSHNFWLDVARNGGWVPFIFSVVLFFNAFRDIWLSAICTRNSIAYKCTLLCALLAFTTVFMLEPIMDGFLRALGAYFWLWGAVQKINR